MLSSLSTRLFPAGAARFRPLFTLASWYVCLGLLLRLVLWWSFGRAQQVGVPTFIWTLAGGAIADSCRACTARAIRDLSVAHAGPALSLAPARSALLCGRFRWMFGLMFVAAIEYFFFEEFDARLNLVAVDYLMYPTEVVGDIWAAYPVSRCGVLALVSAARRLRIARQLLPQARHGSRIRDEAACSPHFAALTLRLRARIRNAYAGVLGQSRGQRDRRERRQQLLPRAAHERDRLSHLLREPLEPART